MIHIRSYFLGLTVLGIFVLSMHTDAIAVETCDKWIAKAVSVQGEVHARTKDENQWNPVQMDNTFCAGDMLRVQGKSRAAIVLINDTIIRLDQNTTITFTQVEKKKTSVLDIITGAVHFISRVPRTLKVSTPFVNGNVEGTEFLVRVFKDSTLMTVYEGKVLATNQEGSLELLSGQSAITQEGRAPAPHVVVEPRDAVQWALYYPPVLEIHMAYVSATDPGWKTAVYTSGQFYLEGDIVKALSSLEKVTEKVSDPEFYTYRASLLLSVGRVDEALNDISQALNIKTDNSDALALQSLIAVVQNEKEKAMGLANKAVEADPDSATAHIAASYTYQANFNLDDALTSIQKAVELEPGNSLAWARLAELRQSFQELDESLDAARKAVSLNPNLSRTQTVLGFAYLMQVKTDQAVETFNKAIKLDQADPLPRLGLGLAQIRESKLKEGRENMEIAASLDPGSSLIRSYMGKAYYEEKRDKLAESQYDMAQNHDPKDPTPFFYDAIRKQSINRPVEALHDLQKAIELNDNRAIYRSKLLLDNDLAARSASLARIYSDLGFQQRALAEGWKSVNIDPGNYSAHRFLADSYSALPQHEIARVSELLQSQLRQPINVTPVQPSLGESNLLILDGAGPGNLSFNEFNPMFNRNRIAFQASGIAGSNSTLGDEVVVSGVYNKVSLSAGQFHYESDGFRENNDQEQDIYNVFGQISFSYRTSIQAEYRHKDIENGDLSLRFFPDDFLPNQRQEDKFKSSRLGFHHIFSPGSDIIGSFILEEGDGDTHITSEGPGMEVNVDSRIDSTTYLAELQYLYRIKVLNVVFGGGYVKTNFDETSKTEFIFIPPFMPPQVLIDETDNNIDHYNVYLYSQIKYPENVIWTIGGSADFLDDDEEDFRNNDQFNPKLGLNWTPFPDTTIRAAYFKVLKRTLTSTNQTIEPTQVAGFNQFFDDRGGTETENYGIAIDQKFTADLYGGAEYSHRDLEVPETRIEPPATIEFIHKAWEDRVGRVYLYWTPHPWFSLLTAYHYERHEEEDTILELLNTHRVPLGINFYHSSGLTTQVKATYYDQEGRFRQQGALDQPAVPDADNFWIIDASVSYRLPKRYGIISVVGKNVFDQSFKYYDLDPRNPVIQPGSSIFIKFTLSI